MYSIKIDETARDRLTDKATFFNEFETVVDSLKAVREFLTDRYGRIPHMRNKIYVDDKDGNPKVIGFLYSFWNKDWSHNSKSWFQTDWIEIREVHSRPLDLKYLKEVNNG